MNLVICSIWQHLRRIGKATDDDMPEYADSFWDKIPDTLPREMEWINPKPARILLNLIISIIVTTLLAIGVTFLPGYKNQGEALFFAAFIAITIGFLCGLFIWQELIIARKFHLNGDQIEAAKALDVIKASFSEVTRVVLGIQTLTIYLNRKHVRVPFNSSDENSQKLRLALIRVLRKHGHLRNIPIPDELRRSRVVTKIPIREPIELRLSRLEILFWPAMCWLYALLSLLMMTSPGGNSAVSIGVAIGLVLLSIYIYNAARSIRYVINSEGISKHCLNWTKLVKWSHVAEYKIVPQISYKQKRLLRDAKGISMMEVGSSGNLEDIMNFLKHLDSNLADKIKGYDDKREWLAQPWEPES